jgi:predicted ATPase/DNA-binding winged helix-turn-helix (wHTH) protein
MSLARGKQYRFGRFRLDCAERTLHHAQEPIELRDKAFDLLALLLAHAPRLVNKTAIRSALWPGLTVHDNNLAVTASALRKALSSRDPSASFIETVPRRGYRWVHAFDALAERSVAADIAAPSRLLPSDPVNPCVGRERELGQLLEHWRGVGRGGAPLLFVSGEPGIGKTTLLAHFAERVRRDSPAATVMQGACLELFGPAEPYLPWFGALKSALSGPERERWLELLRRHAPAWCRHLPRAQPESDASPSDGEPRNATAAGPLSVRQLVEALLGGCLERPLLVLLEDVHWADGSSVDALRALDVSATQHPLLVVASYRPAELRSRRHALCSLIDDLSASLRHEELPLAGWQPAQLEEYLVARFGRSDGHRALAQALWQRTEGSPFFATRLADSLAGSPVLLDTPGNAGGQAPSLARLDLCATPSVSALIQRQLDRIPRARRRVLDAASVAGPEFSTALLARVLSLLPAEIERQLDGLASLHGLLDRLGDEEASAGAASVRYRFRHVLIQSHVYEQLGTHRRRRLHLLAARALLAESTRPAAAGFESSTASRAASLAAASQPARLAAHFERGGQLERAVAFWTEAGDQAERAHAKSEALECYARGEALISELPRDEQDLHRLFIRHGQGWANFNLRRLDVAERNFEDVARLAKRLHGHAAACVRRRAIAFEYFTRPWADELINRPSTIVSAHEPGEIAVELQAEALHCCCQILSLGERSGALLARAEQLLELATAHGSSARRAEALCFLAEHAMRVGRVQRAQQLLDEALLLSRSRRHARALCITLQQRAALHLVHSEFAQARGLYRELLEVAAAADVHAVALLGLAEALAKLGDVRAALGAQRRVRALFERMDPPRPPMHGWLARELGQWREAQRLDQAAIAALRPLGDSHRLSNLLASSAHTHCHLGDVEAARRALEQAEAHVAREHRECAGRMYPLWAAESELALRLRRWDELERSCQRWLELAQAQGHAEAEADARRKLACVCLVRREPGRARRHVEAALDRSRTHPNALSDWRSHLLLAQIAERTGDAELAAAARARAQSQVSAIAGGLDAVRREQWLAACSEPREEEDRAWRTQEQHAVRVC